MIDDGNWRGVQRLARCVLISAVRDAAGFGAGMATGGRMPVRAEARAFLLGESGDLRFWCDILGFDPSVITQAVRRGALSRKRVEKFCRGPRWRVDDPTEESDEGTPSL